MFTSNQSTVNSSEILLAQTLFTAPLSQSTGGQHLALLYTCRSLLFTPG